MKPAAFEYHAPTTLDETLEILAGLGDDAKVLAGGQSLVPMMNFRLVRPAHLIDLNRIVELRCLQLDTGELRIGSMVRQRALERSVDVAHGWPLLVEALGYVGHPRIRNRGTIGGSLAHADPAAELPAVMIAQDAVFVLRGAHQKRVVDAETFFVGYFSTALESTELLVEIRVPARTPGTVTAFEELSRRQGDFAMVGIATSLRIGERGRLCDVRLVSIGVGPTPLRMRSAEAVLEGQLPGPEVFDEAARLVSVAVEPESDLHASAEYRREQAGVLARRALTRACTHGMSDEHA